MRRISGWLLASGIIACLAGSAWAADEALMNDTLKTIFSRKSVRTFKSEPVPKEKLEVLIRAGMAAPTAVDKRPWEFIVVTDRAVLKPTGRRPALRQDGRQGRRCHHRRGRCAKAVGRDEDSDYWIMDCSAATENILIAAESMGLGAVWTAVYPEESRIRTVRQVLGHPFSHRAAEPDSPGCSRRPGKAERQVQPGPNPLEQVVETGEGLSD